MGLSNSPVSFCGQGDNNVLQQSKKQRSQSVLNNIKVYYGDKDKPY